MNHNLEDTFKLQGKRRQLVENLKKNGITDIAVLEAIGRIPRHYFVGSGLEEKSYEDIPLPIGSDQTISQPFTVAYQTQLLEVHSGQKILEIGTGSGYQASVLCELGAKVYSIERYESLHRSAVILLKKIGYNVNLFFGDGYKGLPTYGPFDRILITAGAPEIPEVLLEQLKPMGILVIPVGSYDVQKMIKIIKMADGTIEKAEHEKFIFVPMLKGKVAQPINRDIKSL